MTEVFVIEKPVWKSVDWFLYGWELRDERVTKNIFQE